MNMVLKLVFRAACPPLPNIKCEADSEVALYFAVILLSAGVEWVG